MEAGPFENALAGKVESERRAVMLGSNGMTSTLLSPKDATSRSGQITHGSCADAWELQRGITCVNSMS